MTGITVCVAALLLAVDGGWQPLPEGGMQYTIQIEPGTLESMKAGEPVESYVPLEVHDVRVFRLVVGTGRLVQKLPANSAASPPAAVLPPTETRWPPGNLDTPGKPRQSSTPPATLPPGPPGKALAEQRTTFEQSLGSNLPAGVKSSTAAPPAEAAKPWLLFAAVQLLLFASLGGNLYLGWITWDVRNRYRRLLGRTAEPA